MKRLTLLLLCSVSYYVSNAQVITGIWEGVLEVQNTKLPLVFKIHKKGSLYVSTMDSPAQGAKDIPVDTTLVKGEVITFSIKNAGISYEGKVKNDSLISGAFKQSGAVLPLNLLKKKIKNKE
ncbi:hypothetical protein [Aquimarina intermedia]|uniref:Alpha/beta hydrolase n=1 Tax=Aquimarina intermedia TaxID=350814 RepID=A0A5S5CCA0_9FLAO|nr:hypothetical protein [Aquimarina intermedia]TYP76977.1 hypothetical protein BD809_101123 [Aquimarina intermedia]